MKSLSKTSYHLLITFFCFFLSNISAYSQEEPTTIELVSDTSGYLDFSEGSSGKDIGSPLEVVPTIKGELNVTEQGTLTYSVPIEVFKGVNDFQPNLALVYNSQAGNGQAGMGWGIAGLSSITIGGKSKRIDGTNEGFQYDGTDPYYLDGQRLIQVGTSNQYITEKYSQIKITKTDENHFKIQYTDGKIAKYQYKALGQFLITEIQDAYGNKVFYAYTVLTGVPYISTIKYGGTSQANSPFSISFSYLNKQVPLKIYRNGTLLNNSQFLKEIQVNSTTLGLHRKYILTHDITSAKVERLRKIEIENSLGKQLKPLIFNYNKDDGSRQLEIQKKPVVKFLLNTKKIGDVIIGDFTGNGQTQAVIAVNDKLYVNEQRTVSLVHSKLGPIKTTQETGWKNGLQLMSGRIIEPDGKYSENDRIVQLTRTHENNGFISLGNNEFFVKRKHYLDVAQIDYEYIQIPNSRYLIIPTGYDYQLYGTQGGGQSYIQDALYKELTGDFNNDGLVDKIIFLANSYAIKGATDPRGMYPGNTYWHSNFSSSKKPSKVLFYEIGKNISNAGEIPYTESPNIGIIDEKTEFHTIEFNGDQIPEILKLDRTNKKFSIYKIEYGILSPIVENISLSEFGDKTPLIFGDFNGDGLTDFITPVKVYDLEGSNITNLANSINSEHQWWWQYINTGNLNPALTFTKTKRSFDAQKLAYCKPSNKNIFDEKSDWQIFWGFGNVQDEYTHTQYAACGIIPVDFNNDGKTDLVSFSKFGEITFKENLMESVITNVPVSVNYLNKLRFIENVYDANNVFSLQAHSQNEINLVDKKISPFAIPVNNNESRSVELQVSGLKIIDPFFGTETNYDINSTEFLENQIQEVNNGSGVNQRVEYAPASTLVKSGSDITWHLYYKYKPEEVDLPYPYFVNKHQPNYLLVKRVNTIFDGTAVSKEYRYENAIQNFDGKGFLGFQKIKISDPYESKLVNNEYLPKNPFEGVIWTVNTYDPESENALVRIEYGSLDGEDILTSTENEYERKEKPNKQYTYINTKTISEDFLKGVTITKNYSYSEPDWLLEEVSTNYNGEATSTTSFEYKPAYSIGDYFFYGRITLNEQTISKGGETFITKDEYEYPSQTFTIHRKYGNGTPPLITERTYFTNGNLKSEKISGSGIAPLTTTYAYESTNRYINKVTAPDGLIAQSVINILGQVESETSPLGLVTTYQYDGWGNKVKVVDFLGLETNLIKTPHTNGQYSLSTQKTGNPTSIVFFDRFDRPVKTKTQSINNKWLISDIVYDIYGKKIKESESYFQDSPNILWNEFEYDALDRLVEQKLYTGKVITTCYEGMTVTVEDGEQKTSKTLDTLGNVIKHTDMGGEILYDYYPNGTLKTANYDGIIISVEQDGWGNKTSLTDPSAGTYTYDYDILGRLLIETTPKGQTEYVYDDFGKLISETSTGDETNITATYIYDPVTKLPEKIIGTTDNGAHSFEYETLYDQYFRINGKKETLTNAFVYQTNSEFDVYGRLKNTTLTTTITNINKTTISKIENLYEVNSGILIEQKDILANRRIWKIDEVNQKGQTKQMTYGNNFILTNEYNNFFLPTKIKDRNDTTNQTALEIDYIFDSQKKRLNSRDIYVFSKFEEFNYDDLDRLVLEKVNNAVVNEYTYDVRGRMTYNKEVGTYEYTNTDYHIEKFKFNKQGQNMMDGRGFHQLKFNAFKQATEIYLPGHGRINYDFNLFKKRAIAYYGSEDVNKDNRPIRKYYTSDNAVEIIYNNLTGETQVTTYVDGDPYSSSYIKVDKYTGTTTNSSINYYLHRDYQGSILALSNVAGRVVEQRYFDAWGNIKQVKHTTWNGTTPTVTLNTTLSIIDRGYTGHEHLQSVGLIHMNGRLYDPVIRRFLSPDNFVQDPYNTQNFDRYSYVLNNPLIYADPSGESYEAAIMFGVMALYQIATNVGNNRPWFQGIGKLWISSNVSYGIGYASQYVTSVVGTLGGMAFQAVAHGISGGVMSNLDGGNFESGFAAGAVSSLIASSVQIMGESSNVLSFYGRSGWSQNTTTALTIAAGGLSGGLSSTIAGGNFWKGAKQGLITSGLNHVAHSIFQKRTISEFQYGDGDPRTNNGLIFENDNQLRDYINDNIGDVDRIEKDLKTKFHVATNKNLPEGYYLDGTQLKGSDGWDKGGITLGKGNKSSIILISPNARGECLGTLDVGKMVIVHEMVHAQNWLVKRSVNEYNTHSESAASTYSYIFLKYYGQDQAAQHFKGYMHIHPSSYSFTNLPSYISKFQKK